jgi:tetratricopeptide (TPR) repeat protein
VEASDERELRKLLLLKLPHEQTTARALDFLTDATLSWEQKRPIWFFLYNTGRERTAMEALETQLKNKERVPFDLLITLSTKAAQQPEDKEVQSLIKGLRKQQAFTDLMAVTTWDHLDGRLAQMRAELTKQNLSEQQAAKENMREKFYFLKNQRMSEQAGRVLQRMLELYPEDQELAAQKLEFDEQWAREVLSNHVPEFHPTSDRTKTGPGAADQAMLKAFMAEGEKLCLDQRSIALDLAVAFWFMDEYDPAIEILSWAEPGVTVDWMRAEVLFAARRFLEALEHLNTLEIKYVDIAETTFAANYLRAQCLYGLGQRTSAMEIMQSIVRVRSQYRSAHALILEWSSGANWE